MNEKIPFKGPMSSPKTKKELTPGELREKLKDPSFLPSHKDIFHVFGSKPGKGWLDFCFDKINPVFEFLNEEFLESFSDYLSKRSESLGATKDSPITILEVGAGNGRLSHFLQKKLESKIPGKVKVIATDSGGWNIKTSFPVEKIDHKEALEKYQPKIVIFSWMPLREDYTNDFRATKSIEEYILIGETDCCGDGWKTWGNPHSYDNNGRAKKIKKEVAPYIADGFELEDIADVSKKQICRTDLHTDLSIDGSHSHTMSFKRAQ